MTLFKPPINKSNALMLLGFGGFLPLSLFLLMTWLSVKVNFHIPQADWLYWLIYAIIALPLFWLGLSYWLKNKTMLIIASLLLLVAWGVVMAISVLFFHLSIGGTL